MNLIRLDFNMLWLMEVPKELERRPASDKILRDKAFNISKNPKYHAYQRGLPYMVYKSFDKKSAGIGVNMHGNKSAFNNEKLAEELHKSIIRKFKNSSLFRI